ncbi:MAG: galactose-1-phosphate uridylyltransferase [Thermoguttaceae bacterium]
MSQYRKDPLSGRWVIIAEERASRPNQFDINAESSAAELEFCPFCPGNEDQTTSEIDRIDFPPSSDKSGWAVRAILNKYPAVGEKDKFPDYKTFQMHYGAMLEVDAPLSKYEDSFSDPIPGFGSHELIIDTPRHVLCLSEMTQLEITNMLKMYRSRLLALRNENKYAHALIFKNVGCAAGASLYHSHSQLMAMPFLSPFVQRELKRAIGFSREMHNCFWCTQLEHEIKDKSRVIEEGEFFVSLCPYVSRFPNETAIYPKTHISHFEFLDDAHIEELAYFLRQTVTLLGESSDMPKGKLGYNMIVKSGPFFYKGPMSPSDFSDSAFWLAKMDYAYENVYHFHINILPSLAKAAGFEWGSGLHINPIAPETAAARLREILETKNVSEELA